MHGFPLAERLQADLGIAVAVHHDAAACALAEVRWGVDRGVGGLAYLTCGTGFGAGIVIDGRARYSTNGLSPEIGHVRYRDDGPEIFGKPGCFESYGSASVLPALARRHDPRFSAASGEEVARRAQAGVAAARAALDENAEAVGAACALLVDLLVLDVIVLGSLAAYLGEPWIARVRETFVRETLADRASTCTLRAPSLEAVQDLSGLAAALDAATST
jgi:glucokinase